jgi:hypothetical protein
MSLDPPKPGQVIGYRYLWWSEHRKGLEEGAKDRPCAVVYAVETKGRKTRVYVLPITHTKPFDTEDGLQMLPQWKKHLGLDDESSWIMTEEAVGLVDARRMSKTEAVAAVTEFVERKG